jgi:O-antigen/teichoic acid export membrane protein
VKSNLRQFIVYQFGSVLQSLLPFLLLPLYLNRLSPAEYGVVSLLLAAATAISLLARAGVLDCLYRYYYGFDAQERQRYAGTTLCWVGAMAIGLGGLIALAAPAVGRLLPGDGDGAPLVRWWSLNLALTMIQTVPFRMLQLQERPAAFVTLSVTSLLTNFVGQALLVGVLRRGVLGFFEASVISACIVTAGLLITTRHSYRLGLHREPLRRLLALGIPFVVYGLSFWVLNLSDRFVLGVFADADAVGLYTLAHKLSSVFNVLLLGPVGLFWGPFLFSSAAEQGEEGLREICRDSLTMFAVVGGALFVAISVASHDVLRILTRESAYLQAAAAVPFLTLAPYLTLMTTPDSSVLLWTKRLRPGAAATVVAAVLNVLLNLLLVPYFSWYGATAATVVAFTVQVIIMHVAAQRVLPISYYRRRVLVVMAFALTAGLLPAQIPVANPWLALAVHETTGLLLFGALLWLAGVRPKLQPGYVPALRQAFASKLDAA